jgi:hypothetical protein
MTRCLIWVSVVSLVWAGVARASVQQGDTELELLGAFVSEDASGERGADVDAWFAAAALGYFVTDNLQLAGAGFGFWSDVDIITGSGSSRVKTSADVDVLGVGGKARWFFLPKNQWVPYLGAQLLYADADVDIKTRPAVGTPTKTTNDLNGTLWGPLAGLRFELNATNDFFVEYQYQIWEGNIGAWLDDGHALVLGIVHQFK